MAKDSMISSEAEVKEPGKSKFVEPKKSQEEMAGHMTKHAGKTMEEHAGKMSHEKFHDKMATKLGC